MVMVLVLCCVICFFQVEVPTGSMLNTIAVDSRLLALRDFPCVQYERGDILVFRHQDTMYVKRLLGLPGEVVEVKNGLISVNGERVVEPYLSSTSAEFDGIFYVPEDSYFFVGDNRANSFDSRAWTEPFVSVDSVCGRVLFSFSPTFKILGRSEYE